MAYKDFHDIRDSFPGAAERKRELAKQERAGRVRLDCHVNNIRDYLLHYPRDHFEIMTGRHLSPLAPGNQFLHETMSKGSRFSPGTTQTNFRQGIEAQIRNSPKAQACIKELRRLLDEGLRVFLVGLSPNPKTCGRDVVKRLILEE